MTQRKKTISVNVGPLKVGSEHPVIIQSMTKTPTVDITRTLDQIRRLACAGCQLVRIAVPTRADTAALEKIIPHSPLPVVADIHFSPDRAIEAISAGAVKIRLNPGNIKDPDQIKRIISAARQSNTAIRIGINEASIRDLKNDTPLEQRPSLMLEKMKSYTAIFEQEGFTQLVLSAKSADISRTIRINQLLSQNFDYPIHVGLTHAGLPEDAQIPSAIAVGSLLNQGIGDTVRISLAGDPVGEVRTARQILLALGLQERKSPEFTVCPTCGRTYIDVLALARKIKQALQNISKPVRIAVMGCVVNGPGEAADADIAVCVAKNKAYIYRDGRKIKTVSEDQIIPVLRKQLEFF